MEGAHLGAGVAIVGGGSDIYGGGGVASQQLISVHREDAFCFESALAVDVHAGGGGGNNLWRNIEEELPVIFYLWAGVVMTLDGARRLLQAQHAGTDVEACLHVSRAPC